MMQGNITDFTKEMLLYVSLKFLQYKCISHSIDI